MKSVAALCLFLLAASGLSPAAASVPLGAPRKAPGGKADLYGCMQSNDYYIVNFAAYQTDADPAKDPKALPVPECIDLPRTGPTQIAVDMLDRDVRRKAVVLKVIAADGRVLAETPPAEARQGVMTTRVDFGSPGKYELVIYVEDHDLNLPREVGALHIPLAVAVAVEKPAPASGLTGFFVILAGLIAALAIYLPRWLKGRDLASSS